MGLTAYPILKSFYWSFTHYGYGTVAERWIGLANYDFIVNTDPDFRIALKNSAFMAFVGLPVRMATALGLAMLLARPRRGISIYRTFFYVPTLVPAVAATLTFVYLLNPSYGPVTQLLHAIGIADPPLWFYDPNWAKPSLITLGVWGAGDTMIIYLAGLVDVPRSLYEAASIDGARAWARFRNVTLPMLSPITFFTLVTGVIGVLQSFDEAYVASGAVSSSSTLGNPEGSLLFYPVYLYANYRRNRIGLTSAIAWVLFGLTMILTLVILRTRRRWVHTATGEA